jgi:hypothetical protein
MKRGGVIRFILPDAQVLIAKYLSGELGQLDELNDGCEAVSFQSGKLWSILFSGHHAAYDFEAVQSLAKQAGFDHVEKKAFREGHPQILAETIDVLPDISLFVEIYA